MAFLQQLDGFDASSLNILQRILLISDGTLTDTLEAAFLEPIAVRKIHLTVAASPAPVPDLGIAAGEALMQRKILLHGETSGRNYIYAESLLVLDRLPQGFRTDLAETNIPVGRLWSKYKLETRKELLGVWRGPCNELAEYFRGNEQTDLLARRYRLISGGCPLMLITERIPTAFDSSPG
jgi:chorismate-pyruvate lyase